MSADGRSRRCKQNIIAALISGSKKGAEPFGKLLQKHRGNDSRDG